MHLWQWLGRHDRDYAALRRAGRTAIAMPGLFALGDKVFVNVDIATFGAFGAFAMLLLVDFGGPMAERLQAQAALAFAGAILICLGTLASATPWLAAAGMAVVGFGVLFAGVVSSTLATASTALLLAFILPVSLPAPVSAVPERLAGWGLASVSSLIAIALLWPVPARDRLRPAAVAACEALAGRLRAEVAFLLSGGDQEFAAADRERAMAQAQEATEALRRTFLATPYLPGGLRTSARTITRLVAEVGWLNLIINKPAQQVTPAHGTAHQAARVSRPACAVKIAAAAVLERGAELLTATGGDGKELDDAMSSLRASLTTLERHAAAELPGGLAGGGNGASAAPHDHMSMLVSALDPAFRAQEAGYAVTLIGRTIALTAAAERRSWLQRVLGRQPEGVPGTLSVAEARAAAHAQPHSVWLRNSVRAAAGLGLAVLLARLTGVQHSFWVVLGTLSVLRSNALSTGQDALRALAGTVAGLVIGAGILAAIGPHETALWIVLPFAVLLAGVAPAAISFAAGQAAFTLTLGGPVQPDQARRMAGRVAPPGGHRPRLRREHRRRVCCSGRVARARCSGRRSPTPTRAAPPTWLAPWSSGSRAAPSEGARSAEPAEQASRAFAADQRLDDAFRAYLAEHGPKPVPLAEIAGWSPARPGFASRPGP